jgi:hypothetical protein
MKTCDENMPARRLKPNGLPSRARAGVTAARRFVAGVAGAVALSLVAPSGAMAAVTYWFMNITNNNAGDAAVGEAQLFVDVSDLGGGEVLFNFRNIGPDDVSITAVYFDDGTLLDIARLIDADENGGDAGVDFTKDGTGPAKVSPGNLPGGNDIDFEVTAGFSADADPPTQPNGVNPGESLGVVFSLQSGVTFADTLTALELSQTDLERDFVDGLRIGIRGQGFEGGGSEGFVNYKNGHDDPKDVPMPATLILFGLGLVSMGALLRRRSAA